MTLPCAWDRTQSSLVLWQAGEHSSLRRGGKKKKRGEKKKKKGEGKKEEKREEKGEGRGKEGNLKSCISVSTGIATADSLVGAVSACLGLISAAKQFPPPPFPITNSPYDLYLVKV